MNVRSLMSPAEVESLERLFDALVNGTRLRWLHALSVVDLGILSTKRHGNHLHYRIVDACAARLLEHGRCLYQGRQPLPGASA